MRITAYLLATAILGASASAYARPDPTSDAPDPATRSIVSITKHDSYGDALASWRRPEDINEWIAASFEYDIDRAVALSESQRANGRAPQIFEPATFYDRPRGVCVDLARFGVETLKRIAPQTNPKYLMIEFNPVELRGQVLRKHWVAIYEDEEGLHVFADSKRPGYIAGPYGSIAQFIDDYSAYRNRRIVGYREVDSFQRRSKTVARSTDKAASTPIEAK